MPFLRSSNYANTQIRVWYGVKWMKKIVGAAARKLQTVVKMDGSRDFKSEN